MKKNLTTILSFAMTLFVAFTTTAALTACSNDENEPGSIENITNGVTEFTAERTPMQVTDAEGMALGEGTRTSLDTAYNFFWENGDKIFVKKGSEWKPSTALSLTEKKNFAKFTVDATFTNADQSVDVVYTGTNSASAESVEIKAVQEQKSWNVATHLGTSGDCGTATATRNPVTGTYSFNLEHKASYLILYPYLDASQSGYNLTSIDIESQNGTELAGTFAFSMSGLSATATSSGTNKITLTLSTSSAGLPLQNTQPTKANGNHCYVVIRPGSHNIKITYHLKNPTNATDVLNVEQLLGTRTFSPNGVSIISCNMKTPQASYSEFDFTTFEDIYYLWDAKKWYWYGMSSYPTQNGFDFVNEPYSGDPNRWYNTAPQTENLASNSSAANSAKYMPCYNAMTWYLKGGAYWDITTEWTIGGEKMTGGIWLKKWNKITGKPSGATITSCSRASGITEVTPTKGKPSNTADYFFLPALGLYNSGRLEGLGMPDYLPASEGAYAWYWSSSPYNEFRYAYYLRAVYSDMYEIMEVKIQNSPRDIGFVAGSRPDGTRWFQ